MLDGGKPPAESGDKSPHSKAAALLQKAALIQKSSSMFN